MHVKKVLDSISKGDLDSDFGKFMNVPYETPRNLKSKYGHLAYVIEAIKNFVSPTELYDITYKIDDKIYSGE